MGFREEVDGQRRRRSADEFRTGLWLGSDGVGYEHRIGTSCFLDFGDLDLFSRVLAIGSSAGICVERRPSRKAQISFQCQQSTCELSSSYCLNLIENSVV